MAIVTVKIKLSSFKSCFYKGLNYANQTVLKWIVKKVPVIYEEIPAKHISVNKNGSGQWIVTIVYDTEKMTIDGNNVKYHVKN
jgi:hypothetical protein